MCTGLDNKLSSLGNWTLQTVAISITGPNPVVSGGGYTADTFSGR